MLKCLLQFLPDRVPDLIIETISDLRKSLVIKNSPDCTIVESQVTTDVTGNTIGTTTIVNVKEAKVGEDANEELFPGIGLSKTKRSPAEMCFELSGLSL